MTENETNPLAVLECVLRQCDDWPPRKSSAPESNAEPSPTGASREWRKSNDIQWSSTPTRNGPPPTYSFHDGSAASTNPGGSGSQVHTFFLSPTNVY